MNAIVPIAVDRSPSHDELQRQLARGVRRNALVIAACAALGVVSGFGYGYSAGIHVPVAINLVVSLWIAGAARVERVRRTERLLFWVNYGLFAYLALVSASITTVVLAIPTLAFVYFTEDDPRYRRLATVATALVVGVLYARFWPETNLGISGARMAVEAFTDCALAALFTGLFVRSHSAYMRLVLETAKAKRVALEARVAEAEATARLLEAKRAELEALGEGRRRALAAEQRLAAQLRSRQEQLQQFAYAASHDLKEPIRTVRSFLQVVRKRLAPASVSALGLDGAFDRVSATAEGMHLVLERLLLYTSVAKDVPGAGGTSLAGALRRGLSTSALAGRARLPEIGAEVRVVLAEADLVHVAREIFDNAARFRKVGEAPVCELTYALTAPDWVELAFRDEGIGLAAADRERVFGIFERLHVGGEGSPGAGMGLSIVRKAVEASGGSVTIEGAPGAGTTVRLRLPVAA